MQCQNCFKSSTDLKTYTCNNCGKSFCENCNNNIKLSDGSRKNLCNNCYFEGTLPSNWEFDTSSYITL